MSLIGAALYITLLGTPPQRFACPGVEEHSSASWSPDSQFLAIGGAANQPQCIASRATGQVRPLGAGQFLAWLPNSAQFVYVSTSTAGAPDVLHLADANDPSFGITRALTSHGNAFWTAAFSDDGKLLALTAFSDTMIAAVLDGDTLAPAHELPQTCVPYRAFWRPATHQAVLTEFCTPDDASNSSSSRTHQVELLDVDSGQTTVLIQGPMIEAWLRLITLPDANVWSPDGNTLLTPQVGGDMNLVGVAVRDSAGTPRGNIALPANGSMWQVSWSPDGRRFAIDNGAGGAVIDAQDAHVLFNLDNLPWPASLGQLPWLDNETLLVAGDSIDQVNVVSQTRTVLWETKDRRRDPSLSPDRTHVSLIGATTTLDGKMAVINSYLQVVRLKDQQVVAESVDRQEHLGIRWSPDGEQLASSQARDVLVLSVPD